MASPHSFTFTVMGGPAELMLCAEEDLAKQCAALIEAEARRIEKKFSRYDASSAVSILNSQAQKSKVEVDSEVAALLNYAAVCYEQSDGLFDITCGVLRRVWDFKAKRVPTQAEVKAVRSLIGWEQVEWNPPYVGFRKPGMEIDFGGLGKEYAVDRCVALAQQAGIPGGFVNFAGDVRVIGPRPDGQAWRIGLVHPRKTGAVFGSVEIREGAIATSGDYERFFEVDGKRYSHILNPKTGYPAEGFESVSVMGESCLLAGTASTITMLLGPQRGREFLGELGLPYVLRLAGGQVEYFPHTVGLDRSE
ncbi:MAG: FAD:protein FMN transferase [Deltaproteobacteria bacterium]|nr:FAD:protein FMN transferase [Deltaproteobacteria bacterium]